MFPHAGLLIFPDSRDSLVLTFPSTETAERISLPLIVLEKMSQFPLGAKLGESSRGPLLNIFSSLLAIETTKFEDHWISGRSI